MAREIIAGIPQCYACYRPSEGLVRTDKRRVPGRKSKKVTAFWDSACLDHITAQAFTDPQRVKVHSPNGLLTWEQHLARCGIMETSEQPDSHRENKMISTDMAEAAKDLYAEVTGGRDWDDAVAELAERFGIETTEEAQDAMTRVAF